jgi:hypothetical protein
LALRKVSEIQKKDSADTAALVRRRRTPQPPAEWRGRERLGNGAASH